MLMTDYERKQFIGDLQAITDELEIIDFLREHFRFEYPEIFDRETEERIKIAQNKISYAYDVLGDFDIRRYTFFVLEREIPKKYDISSDYIGLNVIKVFIFFENLVIQLNTKEASNTGRSKKIEESKIVYSFFRGLIANGKFNLSKYHEAIRILGFVNLTQEHFDNDTYNIMKDCIIGLILDKYLTPFIEEYKNYL